MRTSLASLRQHRWLATLAVLAFALRAHSGLLPLLGAYEEAISKCFHHECTVTLRANRPRFTNKRIRAQLPSISPGDRVNHRVFMTAPFARWLRRSPLSERELCAATREMIAGLIDADLGGHVLKKRVAAPSRGKRGSARVLIGTNLGDRWFFLFGFEKNERDSISDRELSALQKLAAALLKLDPGALAQQLDIATLTEICRETKPHTH